MPRSTAAKIFPATKAIGRIGDTKYSSKDLWYIRSACTGVKLLKAIFMEFKAKIPGTKKSKYNFLNIYLIFLDIYKGINLLMNVNRLSF